MVTARQREFARQVDDLRACRACPNVAGRPVVGAVFGARVMLVGQAPGVYEEDRGRPFAHTAGKRLFAWFERAFGVSEEQFRGRVQMSAILRCFPGKDAKSGGDRVPDDVEIARCGQHLDREIRINAPKLLIAVGTLASHQLVGITQLKEGVRRVHRAARAGRTFDVVVLPHPSGRSTWLNKPENAAMLQESLRLIGEHEAWRKTFSQSSSSNRCRVRSS